MLESSKLFGIWNEDVDEESKKNKIKNIIDGQELIMFFKKDGKIFGATEESRITFAKLKNPDQEDMKWRDEVKFSGYDLSQAIQGNPIENLFSVNDIPKIIILSRDQAENSLMRCQKSQSGDNNLNKINGSKNGIRK